MGLDGESPNLRIPQAKSTSYRKLIFRAIATTPQPRIPSEAAKMTYTLGCIKGGILPFAMSHFHGLLQVLNEGSE
jgi:hypothetical protein